VLAVAARTCVYSTLTGSTKIRPTSILRLFLLTLNTRPSAVTSTANLVVSQPLARNLEVWARAMDTTRRLRAGERPGRDTIHSNSNDTDSYLSGGPARFVLLRCARWNAIRALPVALGQHTTYFSSYRTLMN
jgi:hypothetical protein